jgi:hypothetical protein
MITIIVYYGYKNDMQVAMIEATENYCRLRSRSFRGAARLDIGIYNTINGAKAAWRRIDGPGTRWRKA